MSENTLIEMLKRLQSTSKALLHEFASSSAGFQIAHSTTSQSTQNCATVYVLDSSFNPPSKAHFLLAKNAVARDAGAKPARLLLLLATTNADKAPKPAAFEDRIAMMTLMAQTLSLQINNVPVDVGVTKMPYFADKAKAIDDSKTYGNSVQVHLTGFDTITRIFDAKYYPDDLKLRVLDPFLSKHHLRVNYRLEDKYGDRHAQDRYLASISDGSRAGEGMRKEWRDQIEMVDDAKDGVGISSTQAREAVTSDNLQNLTKFVDDSIAEYIQQMELYRDG